MNRLYRIVVINERTGRRYDSGFTPVAHDVACRLMAKMTPYSWRRLVLVVVDAEVRHA